MTELALLVLPVVAGFLWLLDRKDARATASRDRALDQLVHERMQHRKEVGALLQRIQAPELAVVRHDAEQVQDEPAGAPPVLDEQFWAEHHEHAEHIAKIEAMENAQFDRA